MEHPEVTVAVPVKDRRERMLRCLEALLAQDHPSYEVIVLDNGSSDGTANACRARAKSAPVPVRVESVLGTLGHVRNRGAELARGRLIAFTDSDCVPTPGWLTALSRKLETDERVGVVCGRTLPEEPLGTWARSVQISEFSWRFESCNIMFRRDALRAGTGFDEEVGDGWEDTAAGFDVISRGWQADFEPAALVHHDVTYPGFWYHVRREQRQRNAVAIAARFPEVRRRLLFARVFFNARGAASFFAVVGLVLSRWAPAARLLALPYAPYVLKRVLPWRMLQIMILDASLHVAMVRGAVRYRRFVI